MTRDNHDPGVRDGTKYHFVPVPLPIARDSTLTDKELRLWVVLRSYCHFGTDHGARPSWSRIQSEVGCSRATLWRAQKGLIDKGLLEVESGMEEGKPNTYVVCDPPGWGGVTDETPPGSSTRPQGVSSTRPNQETLIPRANTQSAGADFDRFWRLCPGRRGNRPVGKANTLKAWNRLTIADRGLAVQAITNYAEAARRGSTLPKDPERFLKDNYWRDWIDTKTVGNDRPSWLQ